MARQIQLHLDEPAGAASYANVGAAGGTWAPSAVPPTAGGVGMFAQAVDFLGDAQYRNIFGSAAVEPLNLTVAAWVYLRSYGADWRILHKEHAATPDGRESIGFTVGAGGSISFYFTNSGQFLQDSPSACPPFPLNQWHQLCCTWDGTTLKGYLDGVLISSVAHAGPIDYNTHGVWRAGSTFSGAGASPKTAFDGLIDEICVDDVAFTADQVLAAYRAGLQVGPTGAPSVTASSSVSLVNLALARIGVKAFIASLSEASTESVLAAAIYPQALATALASFPWSFARKHAVLVTSSSAARNGWAYAYDLPSDFLQAQYIWSGLRPGAPVSRLSPVVDPLMLMAASTPITGLGAAIPYELEMNDAGTGRILLTDQASAELIYTAIPVSTVAFPPLFVDALVWLLAAELAIAIPGKESLEASRRERFDAALLKAGAAAFRESKEDPQADSEFIAVRG